MGYSRPPAPLADRIMSFCERKILSVCDDHTQKNIISAALILVEKERSGQTLTAGELNKIQGHKDLRAYIDGMRTAAQANLTDENFETATYWPEPTQTLVDVVAES